MTAKIPRQVKQHLLKNDVKIDKTTQAPSSLSFHFLVLQAKPGHKTLLSDIQAYSIH